MEPGATGVGECPAPHKLGGLLPFGNQSSPTVANRDTRAVASFRSAGKLRATLHFQRLAAKGCRVGLPDVDPRGRAQLAVSLRGCDWVVACRCSWLAPRAPS